jgi:GNAT superfamily N-acetyltransferase
MAPSRESKWPLSSGPLLVEFCRAITESAMTIRSIATDDEILATSLLMRQLRPEVPEALYLERIRGLMDHSGYRLAALEEHGRIVTVAGYRVLDKLYSGLNFTLDDFVTDEHARSRGYGARMFDWLRAEGRRLGCARLQLISKVHRESAHRFYFRAGLGIECFHFRGNL